MNPLTNSQIAEQARKTAEKFGTQTGLGSVSQSYTFGRHQVVWQGDAAEVRDTTKCDAVVFRGTKDECVAWAKSNA